MIFTNPEERRALRAIVFAATVFILLLIVWLWSDRFDMQTLHTAMNWAMGIIGLGMLGYVMENGLRSLKLKAGKDGVEADAGGNEETGK